MESSGWDADEHMGKEIEPPEIKKWIEDWGKE